MGGGAGPTSSGGVKSFRNAVLSSARKKGGGGRLGAHATRSRIAVDPALGRARRVTVKARVVKNTAYSAKAAALHLAYVERDGVEKDGTKGMLYGSEGAVDRKAFAEPRAGEKHQFRLIVSPEEAQDLDLTDYVRRYVARIERDLGRKLEWAAVNHFDTGHPHAHIVVRGIDYDGREVRLDRSYVSHGLRARAEELATEDLGPRQEHELRRQKEREVGQDRLTSLDREIARRGKDDRIDVRQPESGRHPRMADALLIGRLEHLAELRLAERVSPTSWALAPGWQDQLRELGMRGDIIKQMHRALDGDPGRYHVGSPGQSRNGGDAERAPMLHGRIASKGLSDEVKGSFYAIIETARGEGYYVSLDPRAAQELREGDLVSFGTRPRHERPGTTRPQIPSADHVIANKPESEGTPPIGSPEKQQREARGIIHASLSNNNSAPIGNFRDTSNSRTERAASPAAQYQMDAPPRVVRDALRLDEQIRHRGPVWLDRVATNALAHYGFGAEVRKAVEERERVLRDLGVNPADPRRLRKLRELERRRIGEAAARQSGERFLAKTPDRFRGRIKVMEREKGGGSYAIVTDGARFAIVPLTHDVKAQDGKAVTLSRDSQGRFSVRATDKDKGIT